MVARASSPLPSAARPESGGARRGPCHCAGCPCARLGRGRELRGGRRLRPDRQLYGCRAGATGGVAAGGGGGGGGGVGRGVRRPRAGGAAGRGGARPPRIPGVWRVHWMDFYYLVL